MPGFMVSYCPVAATKARGRADGVFSSPSDFSQYVFLIGLNKFMGYVLQSFLIKSNVYKP